jgi:hypothetical protein
MSSHYDTAAGYIKSELEKITDIGNVHINDVRISDAEEVRVNFKYTLTAAPDTGTEVYRAWFVDSPGLDTELATATQTFMTEKWEVHGFLAYVNDPDGVKTFADRSKFEEYRRNVLNQFFKNLGLYGQYGGVNVFKTVGPLATSEMIRARFANILCWHLTIKFEGTYDETF